jgi:hypothetical protein
MNTLQNLLLLIVTLFGIPAGLVISKYTKEEIKKGKLELKILAAACAVIFLASFLVSDGALIRVASGFSFLLAITSLRKA